MQINAQCQNNVAVAVAKHKLPYTLSCSDKNGLICAKMAICVDCYGMLPKIE